MTGHRLEEEKPAFMIDQNDEASYVNKEDVLKVIPAAANLRRSNQLISLIT